MAKAKASPSKVTTKRDTQPSTDVALQWICFGLWEWTLVALSVLLSATLSYYFVRDSGDYTFVVYILASLLCLLPFSLVAERMYAKREPDQKQGFAGVVMVLNAVVVFLATLAALITAVMSSLSIFVNAHASSGTYTVIISSLVVTILGLMLFARIINPPKLRKFTKIFPWLVVIITGVSLVAAIAGPFRSQISSRDDRFIEDNLSTVNENIRSYASENDKLPKDLGSLSLDQEYEDGAQTLVDRDLVSYVPDTKKAKTANGYKTMYYRLCVSFEDKKGSGQPAAEVRELYDLRSNHASGRQCYNLEADVYAPDDTLPAQPAQPLR
jgi:hypothetical protein